MKNVKPWEALRRVLACVAVIALSTSYAAAQEHGNQQKQPHQVVERVTDQLLTVVRSNKDLLEQDPQAYYRRVKEVLEPVVDFQFIAGGVMGPHGKSATPEQRKRFTETFKNSLVETYAKGMANYSNSDIQVIPPAKDVERERRVSVVQEVNGRDGTNSISYTMALNREGEWKLINMVLNGVNLGKTFRNQFAQAIKKHDGNIDAVIANWSTES